VQEVPQLHHDAIVGLELLLHSVELEVVHHVVTQTPRWLQVSHQLQEGRVLVLVILVLYHADQLHSYPRVIDLLPLAQLYADFALNVLSVLKG
jgi:hypothetical protein